MRSTRFVPIVSARNLTYARGRVVPTLYEKLRSAMCCERQPITIPA